MGLEQRRPSLFGGILSTQGGDAGIYHVLDRGLVKMGQLPPIAAAIPFHAVRVMRPDDPPWHCPDSCAVWLMLGVYPVIWETFFGRVQPAAQHGRRLAPCNMGIGVKQAVTLPLDDARALGPRHRLNGIGRDLFLICKDL